ncbi:MAG: hypothetical protein NTY75_03985 [Candidatus Shapirobacteria bacterium]|nr:hypothetical protein [Candidatus Shapirobacteria bacterium]
MKKNTFRIICLMVAILISFWVVRKSVSLRWFGYGSYPTPITDEFDYVWQGVSLKRYGLPMAWTILNGVYINVKLNPKQGDVEGFGINVGEGIVNWEKFKKDPSPLLAVKEIDYVKGKEHMFFVAPFFDHPPLGGLIYSLGVDNDIKNVEDVHPGDFRRPALVMAVITAILLFIFLTLITSNPWVGTLGLVIYSTAPIYLLATRTAFLENVVSPFILIHLILLFLYVKYFSKKFSLVFLISSGVVGGLSVLAKEPAIGFLFGSTILLWKNKVNLKNILLFLGCCAAPILVYAGWGLWLQKDLFMAVLLNNVSRGYFGAIKIVTMLETLKFKDFPTDGWWIWGLLSFALISIKVKDKKILFLTLPLFTHLLTILLIGSGNAPWYWISMIPFLAGCSGLMIWKIINKPNLVTALLFFFIPFSSSYYWGREALGILPSISHYRMSLVVFGLMLLGRIKWGKNIIVRVLWMIFMAWMMYKIVIFNEVFFPYLMAHWGSLSIMSLPNY